MYSRQIIDFDLDVVEPQVAIRFRNAVNAGVPFLTNCAGIAAQADTGDDLEVDFSTGSFINHTRGTRLSLQPLHRQLLEIIAIGGWQPNFEHRLAAGVR